MLYEPAPDPERYENTPSCVTRCRTRCSATAPSSGRCHGNELGYYAEFEFADADAFKAAAATEEFKATGADAAELGVPHSVYVADVNA